MEMLKISKDWAWGLFYVVLLASASALALSKRQREAFLGRFNIRRRRASGASTPPRSFSPSNTADDKPPVTPALDHRTSFPPSRREALAVLAKSASVANRKILTGTEPSRDFLLNNPLPITRSYDLDNEVPKYTPTGFSTAEIKAMGDFPAYDVLSGVPLPQPYENFNPETALPRPYRPIRWAYHQTMSLTKMEPDWWLEVESTYVQRVNERKELYRLHGKMVLDYLPGSELVCKELMEMCLQFYCARYPSYFSLSTDNSTFHNRLLDSTTDIKSMHPLLVLLNNVPEDFAIVLRNEKDGMYYFRAGTVCSSLGWNVSTKIGLQLKDIHTTVADYKEKMSFSMDRYFTKMPTTMPIQRGSWSLEIDKPLFMPPGHPHEALRSQQKPDLKKEDCYLRVDWQTLRRLPLSAGVVFNFKALFTPVVEFRDEPYVPALVLKNLKEGKKNLMEYKGTWHVEHIIIPLMEEYAREQVENGVVKVEDGKEWEVTTLEESPYFSGWEEKWHRQQGF
ncbi:hypothetical protein BJ878DRAFT_53726 [Calycina marina]|uniref:Uncharacterized protein n=1 Tax=Calycina marina TaxID=1763456 RepID=A0A9P7ZAJ7_9HELO|nr:hypothetical protein BJ878DRAFT_53726 [Calycina marina]